MPPEAERSAAAPAGAVPATAGLSAEAPERTWPGLITELLARRDLSRADAAWAMDEVMSGNASPVKLAGFLIALRAKGESVAELTGLAEAMISHALPIAAPEPAVDIVGTGGDRAFTVNISTMAALVVAGAGVTVVKHGNRAASSASGSADVLEALGVRLDQTPDRVGELAHEVGITFCFAQVFHPSMRYAGQTRGELGVPTVFNILGPLTNPAQPRAYAIGAADQRLAPLMAGVLADRGARALVFRGDDGLDELAPTGEASVWLVEDGAVLEHRIDAARDLGLQRITVADLRGGSAAQNAEVVREVLAGGGGAVRETVLLNAAAGLVADGRLEGTGSGTLIDRLHAGLDQAARSIDSGAAADLLTRWVAASSR